MDGMTWTRELENTWRSRFEVMSNPNHLFHRFIKELARSEAAPTLRLAMDEIKRLRNESQVKNRETG